MFTSFLLPSLFEGVEARHLCVFYKQLESFRADGVAFIGESAYFREPTLLEAAGRPEWLASWRTAFGYTPPAHLHGVRIARLPEGLFARRRRRVASSWRLYGLMARRVLPELEAAVSSALDALAEDSPIEAVLQFANNPSVVSAAARRALPVVHNEFGPLRPPGYVMTGYWDRRGVSLGSDARRRYRAFRTQMRDDPVSLLDADEMLHVLRRDPGIRRAPAGRAEYRIGVAVQGEDNAAVQGVDALDLLSIARQHAAPSDIVVRYHPGSQTRFDARVVASDDSPTATGFIHRSDAVLTVSSGCALEALLLGRRAIVVGDSPLAIAADRRFDGPSMSAGARRLALNFLLFGYLVPGALMFDADYIRWRLTEPPEPEIYRHHLRWYYRRLASAPTVTPEVTRRAVARLIAATTPTSNPLAVFGAGQAAGDFVAALQASGRCVAQVFDNDSAKWGADLRGVAVTAPQYRADISVAIASLTHTDEIARQLQALGYPADRIVRVG